MPEPTLRELAADELSDVEVTDPELVEQLLDGLGAVAPNADIPLEEAAGAMLAMLRSAEARPAATAHADLAARVADQERHLRAARSDADNLDNLPARQLLRRAVGPRRAVGESR